MTELTQTITEVTHRVVDPNQGVGKQIDIVLVCLVIVLLAESELLRVRFATRPPKAVRAIAAPIVALVVSFVIVVAQRWWVLR